MKLEEFKATLNKAIRAGVMLQTSEPVILEKSVVLEIVRQALAKRSDLQSRGWPGQIYMAKITMRNGSAFGVLIGVDPGYPEAEEVTP